MGDIIAATDAMYCPSSFSYQVFKKNYIYNRSSLAEPGFSRARHDVTGHVCQSSNKQLQLLLKGSKMEWT